MNGESGMEICFVAHNAYAALTGGRLDHVGGVERQQAMMADWLASRGHKVSMITWGQSGAAKEYHSNVDLHFVCKKSDGVPVIRFIYPRWTSLLKAMNAADADVYYYNLGDLVLGQMVSWAAGKGKASVYSVSSQPKCMRDLRGILTFRERVLYRYGLRNVHKIIVQTRAQADLIRQEYGREAELLPMPCRDLSADGGLASPPKSSSSPSVLWVGRFSAEKRPDWVLAIAARCRNVHFDLIGQANQGTEYSRRFLSQASELKNVTVHGVVQHHDIAAYYRKAKAVLCTSKFEGFPNVFLEAWSVGLPTVTTFDPDSIVSQEGIGFVGKSVDDLETKLTRLLSDQTMWKRCSERARSYFVRNHEVNHVMPGFEEALRVSIENIKLNRQAPLKV